MTTKRIVCHMQDGTIAFLTPTPQGRIPDEAEVQWLARIAAKDAPPDTIATEVVEGAELPPRRFREAWRSSGKGKPFVHLGEARKQLLTELRRERNAKLDDSDKEKSKLDDVGTREQRQALATYRQSLRDLPATAKDALDGITTVEGLLAWQPTWPTIAPTPSEVQK